MKILLVVALLIVVCAPPLYMMAKYRVGFWSSPQETTNTPVITHLSNDEINKPCDDPNYVCTVFNNISFHDEPMDVPRFKRKYIALLTNDRKLEIEIYSNYDEYENEYTRTIDGTLRHADGKSIYFSPEEIADKIIDPALVMQVTRLTKKIIDDDKKWRESNPFSYVDESGQEWIRKTK